MLRTSSIPTAMNPALISPAVARAMCVLPHPGGPKRRIPPAGRLAVCLEEVGLCERMDDLHPDLFLDLLHAANIVERDRWPLCRVRLHLGFELRGVRRDPRVLEHWLAGREPGCELRVRERGIYLDSVGVPLPCLVRLSQVHQDPGQKQLRARISIFRELLGENLRLAQLSEREERAREAPLRRGSRAAGQRLPELALRLRGVAGREHRLREVLTERHVVRRDRQRIPQRLDRCF
jgi:hypothetical protein